MTYENKTKRRKITILSSIVATILLTATLATIPSSSAQSIDTMDLKAYYKFNENSGDLINRCSQTSSTVCITDGDAQPQGGFSGYGTVGLIDQTYSYDDVDDHHQIGTSTSQFNFMHDSTGKFTFNTWYKMNNFDKGTFDTLLANTDATEVGIFIGIEDRAGPGDHAMRLLVSNGPDNFQCQSGNGFVPKDTDWHMVTVQWENGAVGNDCTLTIDANHAGKFTTDPPFIPSNADSSNPMDIGALIPAGFSWGGNLDEMSIWNSILTEQEITDLYNNGVGLELDSQQPVTCNGLTPTIEGTSGDDLIEGTSGDDVIVGLEGNDYIIGKGGNDTICGNEGDDYIVSGSGEDFVRGDAGKDYIRGGAGNDDIRGNGGDDRLHGGSEVDTINGGNGDDILVGGSGNDALDGGGDNTTDICDDSGPTDTVVNCKLTS